MPTVQDSVGIFLWIALWLVGPLFITLVLPLTLYLMGYGKWLFIAWFIYSPFFFDLIFPSRYKQNSRLWETFTFLPVLKGVCNYLQMNFVYEEELSGNQYLLGVCPHGMAGFAGNAIINGYSGFRTRWSHLKLRYLTVTAIFWTPILREITMWLGGCDANRSTAEWLLKNGYTVLILPGGVEEQIHTEPGKYNLYLKGRKHSGIIRLALKFGIPIVPIFAFGPPHFFTPSKTFKPLMLFLHKFRMGIPFFSGWKGTLIPYPDVKLNIIVGKSLRFPKIDEPTDEDIEKHQKQFINAMQDIFERYKDKYGRKNDVLEIR